MCCSVDYQKYIVTTAKFDEVPKKSKKHDTVEHYYLLLLHNMASQTKQMPFPTMMEWAQQHKCSLRK